MEDRKLGLSLKYKLLLLLTLIPLISLSIYFFLATEEFKEDKIAYIHDSSVAVAKSVSTQVRAEVNAFLEVVRPIVSNFDQLEGKFNPTGLGLFEGADRIDALVLFQRKDGVQYQKVGQINRSNDFVKEFTLDPSLIQDSVNKASTSGINIIAPIAMERHLVIAYRAGESTDSNHIVLVGLYRAAELRSTFLDSKLYRTYLSKKGGFVFVGPDQGSDHLLSFSKAQESPLPDGSLEVADNGDKLVGFADVGLSDLKVVSIVYKKDALSAVDKLILKSVTFFIALISLTVVIGLFASIKLTSALSDLYEATKKIAKGEFGIRVKRTSNDEVGGLADGFNFMAEEVSRLMKESVTKARLESELATVKLVQETLFPASESKVGHFRVIGHFEPASECGGDWWNYSQVGDKLFLWIGDATGHGAPAAMVTSAAKSAATIVEDLPFISPGKALGIMNKAIHETSKGKILMTFFVGAIDLKNGEMVYANASHEPPYVIRRKSGATTKKDLEPLLDASGPRLGDHKVAQYNEGKVQLNPGDSILFYTDGIVDLQNTDGKSWGERGFVKTIVESASSSPDLQIRMTQMKQKISAYRSDMVLIDDITIFMCQYEDNAA